MLTSYFMTFKTVILHDFKTDERDSDLIQSLSAMMKQVM